MPRVQRNAEVTWEGNVARGRVEGGSHRIVSSELLARARVTDLAEPDLQRLAEEASAGCTLSVLIEASARVSVTATLEGGTDGD